MPKAKRKKMTVRQVALKHGFRSGLEESVNKQLKASRLPYGYEEQVIEYVQPEKKRKYLPDFTLTKKDGSTMYIESKGRWVKSDRERFDWIHSQYPSIDIRFVFTNPNAKLYKGSKTTYAEYCDKRGWLWSKQVVPNEWLEQCV